MEKHKTTARDVVLLAAPHTWAASTVPALLSAILGYVRAGSIDAAMSLCTLAVGVLMQSSVNAFNDYSDYMRGTDTPENSPDADDAVIVHGMQPRHALYAGAAFLAAAGLAGIYAVVRRGIVPLIIGLAGALTVAAYAFGKKALSGLPVGELVSGFVMGGLITLAGLYLQTGELEPRALLWALPVMLGIALIMFTNNGCDIDRDRAVGRRTLPSLLGRKTAGAVYRALLAVWLALPELILAAERNAAGLLVYPLSLSLCATAAAAQMRVSLCPDSRVQAMSGISALNVYLGLGYMLAILAGG